MQKDQHANSAKAEQRYLQDLSALLDGECSEPESVIDGAVADHDCREKWQSYHLIRDVLQKECHSALPTNFASLVSKEISREENIADHQADVISFAGAGASVRASRAPKRSNRVAAPAAPRWLPFAGLGLAASVAAAGFIGWQVLQNFDPATASPGITVAQAEAPSPENPIADPVVELAGQSGLVRAVYRGDTGTRWVAVSGEHDAKVEQRLNSLLLNHLEDSTMTRVQGMAVHSRLVGYDRAQVDDSF